jgi:glycosyltransferase involved in cell wall biosynthesis
VNSRSLKLGFVSPAWPPDAVSNGIVSYVGSLRQGLRELGHQPYVISLSCSDCDTSRDVLTVKTEERLVGTRIRDWLAFRMDPAEALRRRMGRSLALSAKRVAGEKGIELLEIEETFGLLQLVKPALSIPLVTKLHGPHFLNGVARGVPQNAPFYEQIRHEGVGIALADAVSAPSRDVLGRTIQYYGINLPDAAVIPYPAPDVQPHDRWSLENCDPSRLLFIGRFDSHKGGDVVVDAFRQVIYEFPKVRLWFVGSDDGVVDKHGKRWAFKEYLAERASDAEGRVDFLGRVPYSALPELRRRAFITMVASRYETFSLVTSEAIAYGCPVVATRAGGISEIIEDGVNGLLVQPGDPGDFAAAILRLLKAPDLAAKLAKKGGEDAAIRYHPKTIAHQAAEFYQEVIDKRSIEAFANQSQR